jgi:hypothetical protein
MAAPASVTADKLNTLIIKAADTQLRTMRSVINIRNRQRSINAQFMMKMQSR